MKKFLTIALLLLPFPLFGQATTGYHRAAQVITRANSGVTAQVAPFAQVSVTLSSTGGAVVIYSDPLLSSPIAGSRVTADLSGNYGYYIPLNTCVTENITTPEGGSLSIANICNNSSSTTVFQTNGANNANQSLLNIVAGTGITLSNAGGAVTINAPGTTGIPCFTSTTTEAASTLLALNGIVVGGGAGACPVTSTAFFINSPSAIMQGTAFNTNLNYSSGLDGAYSAAQGSAVFRGANQSGVGGAASAGGNDTVKGGDNAGTNAASTAGSTEITSGQSTAGGLQGLMMLSSAFVKGGGTSTLWNLQCLISSMTVNDCAASPSLILGVALAVNSTTVLVHRLASQAPVNASAAVTVGDTVCAGTTAGKVTDSGGTGSCTAGFTVGYVLSISGTYTLPISGAVTLSSTLPLILIDRTVGSVAGYFSTSVTTAAFFTATNCSSAATPAVCGSAAAGSVLIPTGTTSSTLTVNTTAVTANSQIFFYPDDTLGTKLSTTCNSTLATLVGGSAITTRVAGTSFTITFNGSILTNGVCGSYEIIN